MGRPITIANFGTSARLIGCSVEFLVCWPSSKVEDQAASARHILMLYLSCWRGSYLWSLYPRNCDTNCHLHSLFMMVWLIWQLASRARTDATDAGLRPGNIRSGLTLSTYLLFTRSPLSTVCRRALDAMTWAINGLSIPFRLSAHSEQRNDRLVYRLHCFGRTTVL